MDSSANSTRFHFVSPSQINLGLEKSVALMDAVDVWQSQLALVDAMTAADLHFACMNCNDDKWFIIAKSRMAF